MSKEPVHWVGYRPEGHCWQAECNCGWAAHAEGPEAVKLTGPLHAAVGLHFVEAGLAKHGKAYGKWEQ